MKNIFKTHRLLAIIISILAVCILAVGAYAAVTHYVLNQQFQGTVTISESEQTVQCQLYTQLTIDTPFVGPLAFGSTTEGGAVVFQPVYFNASQIPPSSITVTTDLNPAIATLSFIVGTPSQSTHGCPIVITLTPVGHTDGQVSFTIHVTGTSS